MGTDIHMHAEVRRDGLWTPAAEPEESRYQYGVEEGGAPRMDYPEPYHGRNYNLFAILADVRNGTGFAGVDTGDRYNPISEPRGLPVDLSTAYREALEVEDGGVWFGDHSETWLTIAELYDYDWTQVTFNRGVVDAREFCEFDFWAEPQSWHSAEERFTIDDRAYVLNVGPKNWAGGVSGNGVSHVSTDEMRRLLDLYAPDTQRPKSPHPANRVDAIGKSAKLKGVFTQVTWPVMYSHAAGSFYTVSMPRLRRLGQPEDVRIVFGFDS